MPNLQTIEKQKRWSAAFDAGMLRSDVEKILRVEPFRSMNPEAFHPSKSLFDILFYESRILRLESDEIILRQGEYGSSAFLLLSGSVTLISDLDQRVLGRSRARKKSIFSIISQLWNQPKLPETRKLDNYDLKQDKAYEKLKSARKKLPSDLLNKLDKFKTETLSENMFFGESAAIGRTPHISTAIANGRTDVLEIKWQGLRELMRYNEDLRHQLISLYKAQSLKGFLRGLTTFKQLNETNIDYIIEHSQYENFGKQDWYSGFDALKDATENMDAIRAEEIICEEKVYADSIIIIISGFARVCEKIGQGFITHGLLRQGDIFGLEVLKEHDGTNPEYARSIHALGNTDVLRIPAAVFRELALTNCIFAISQGRQSNLSNFTLPTLAYGKDTTNSTPKKTAREEESKNTANENVDHSENLLSHMISRRFINGTKAMIIDLDRCTGCDDCVRACASAHQNNPRFIRHGINFEQFMVTNACMHCYDPVCLIGCPTGAIFRNPQGGEIIINDQTCIGCATCANSCPYHNIRMVNIRSEDGALLMDQQRTPITKATKCDFCVDQLVSPACVNACPHDAMRRIDFHNLNKNKKWLGL